MPGRFVEVDVRGSREVIRALRRLPDQAQDEMKLGSQRLAEPLARAIRLAGYADGRQSIRAARTVKVVRGKLLPTIQAGGGKKASAVLFGSEFGASKRFGWYSADRYGRSAPRQFRPHLGNVGYWFFPTVRREKPRIEAAVGAMGEALIRQWGA